MGDRLEDMLVQTKLVSEAQLNAALETQKQVGGKLGVLLVKLRYVTEEKLVACLGEQLNLPVLHLKDLVVSPQVSALLDVEVLEKHQMVPIRRTEDALALAVADPLDLNAIEEVRFLTGLRTDLAVAARSHIQKAIDYYCHGRPCPELLAAEAALREGAKAEVAGAGGGGGGGNAPAAKVAPGAVLVALVDLLVEKNVFKREELLARLERGK